MANNSKIRIGKSEIGVETPVYIIAEMSANHNQNFDQAVQLIKAAKEAGADAIKLQTYTPDTITIDCDNGCFRIGKGTIWEGKNLYELYKEAYTPWEWQPKLKEIANGLGMDLFSTPFDKTAVDFLQKMDVPAYKIASFELVDIPLIQYVAKAGKPIIMSTGMATLAEIDEAVTTAIEAGCQEIALLKCTSAYPAPYEEMNLRTICHMAERYGVPIGLSDHTLGIAVPVAAVTLGACIVEKHFCLSRAIPGPDSAFSLEPHELAAMVEAIRAAEKSLGKVAYDITKRENASRVFRRSLFVVKDVNAGDEFTAENVRSIRPGSGLPPKYFACIIGSHASQDIPRGTPLIRQFIENPPFQDNLKGEKQNNE
ncbi:MAG: pseudaminic acid synthase [Porphyromonadaceae bacterium]|nr:MAG: pseudaminic acid synthase [Porphyromonadaceae bacterium]